MKRIYAAPTAEKVAFRYQDQVAASTGFCISVWTNIGNTYCEGNYELVEKKNV